MLHDFELNRHCSLNTIVRPGDIGWVTKDTAILVIHGIGDQLPIETLDQFGRGLVKQYKEEFKVELKLTHELMPKPSDRSDTWFDNVLRIKKEGCEHFIDIYEYYWANYSEDKASWKDINTWLQGVVKGANSFYKKNAVLGKQYKDKSSFFDSRTGNFRVGTYRMFMSVVSHLLFAVELFYKGLIWLVGHIPFMGKIADSMMESYTDTLVHNVTNVIGDIVVYNVTDPKSKFYEVKRGIADGAIKALKYLVEKNKSGKDINKLQRVFDDKKLQRTPGECDEIDKEFEEELRKEELYYPSVIVAGHSLGSQVAYDAINKLNLLINEGVIANYDNKGNCMLSNKVRIAEQLNGFITFGSPLDKIVFFLRENVPDTEFLRQQILDHYHGFKLRPINERLNNTRTNKNYVEVSSGLTKLLEDVQWRNYYDAKDYVSGGLDYYRGLTNIDCQFRKGIFTHSNYWNHDKFYIDIICNYLN